MSHTIRHFHLLSVHVLPFIQLLNYGEGPSSTFSVQSWYLFWGMFLTLEKGSRVIFDPATLKHIISTIQTFTKYLLFYTHPQKQPWSQIRPQNHLVCVLPPPISKVNVVECNFPFNTADRLFSQWWISTIILWMGSVGLKVTQLLHKTCLMRIYMWRSKPSHKQMKTTISQVCSLLVIPIF